MRLRLRLGLGLGLHAVHLEGAVVCGARLRLGPQRGACARDVGERHLLRVRVGVRDGVGVGARARARAMARARARARV